MSLSRKSYRCTAYFAGCRRHGHENHSGVSAHRQLCQFVLARAAKAQSKSSFVEKRYIRKMNARKYIAPNGALFLALMKLQTGRAYGVEGKFMGMFFRLLKLALSLAIVFVCLFGYVLHSQSRIFYELQAALLSVQWMLLVCLAVWCGTFLFLTFTLNDLPLIGLLFIAITAYFIAAGSALDAITFLAGVAFGKGAKVLFESREQNAESGNLSNEEGRMKNEEVRKAESESQTSEVGFFVIGLLALLVFAAWWHLDMSANFYHGPRWMGLWNNPNIYGMLMSAGVVLAVGMLAANSKLKIKNSKTVWFLIVAVGMMAMGLVCSYSRGAWLGTAVGLVYLAWSYGKLRWKYVAIGAGLLALGVLCFWGRTPDTAPWYVKRMDLGRPSAQHRVSAWRGAVQMMRDHPFGVGWGNAVTVYEKNYSPPEDGAMALTTNDYLMLGTQLGWPGLICFVSYVGLSLKSGKRKAESGNDLEFGMEFGIKAACRAGALAMLVAFWFDGGLFTLATAAVFWVLLELGKENAEGRMKNGEKKRKAESGKRKPFRNRPSAIGHRQFPRRVSRSSSFWLSSLLLQYSRRCCCRHWRRPRPRRSG